LRNEWRKSYKPVSNYRTLKGHEGKKMKTEHSYLTHVLIDTSDGQDRSVIASNGECVYIPTPEGWKGSYQDKKAWRDEECYPKESFPAFDEREVLFQGQRRTIASFLANPKYRQFIMHDDPEFVTWTYGLTPRNPLTQQLLTSGREGDLIFLGATMKLFGAEQYWAKFLIGVLVLEALYYAGFEKNNKMKSMLESISFAKKFTEYGFTPRLAQNFHYKAEYELEGGDGILIITGNQQTSVLLDRCPIRITEWNTRNGEPIKPFKDWDRMPHFFRGSPGIHSTETAEKIWNLIHTVKRGDAFVGHPDSKIGTYHLALSEGSNRK